MNTEQELLELRLEIAKIKSRLFDGKDLEENTPRPELKGKTPRQIMRMISEGQIENQHVGKKSYEVLRQEGFSLKNRFKPQTMTNTELEEWNQHYEQWLKQTDFLGNQEFNKLRDEIEKMLKGTP